MSSIEAIWKTEEFLQDPGKLLVPFGTDESGVVYYKDIREMRGLLIAGKVCSGKSTFLRGMIESLKEKNTPETLRFILIDPKKTEFTGYENDPFLLFPVLYRVEDSLTALRWCVAEMNRRELFLKAHQNSRVENYNRSATEKLPFIVVVIEEFADLMNEYPGEVEEQYIRIVQIAKLFDIALVVSLQREDQNAFTPLLLANTPNRIAFQSVTREYSEYFLGVPGAESLSKPGECLVLRGEGPDTPLKLTTFDCPGRISRP